MTRVAPVPWFMFTEAVLSAAFAGSFTIVGVYYVTEFGLSPLQLILVGTVMEVTSFLFEIPTGVVADTYSRRLSLIIGWFLHGAAFLVIALAPSYETILVGSALSGLAFTFESGAYEAWITDEVGAENVGPIFVRGYRWSYAGALAGIGALSGVAAWLGLAAGILGGAVLGMVVALSAIVLMPETGFHKLPSDERAGWRKLVGTAVQGGRVVKTSPVLGLILVGGIFGGMSTEAIDRLWEAHLLRDVGLPSFGLATISWFGLTRIAEMLLGLLGTTLLLKRIERVPATSMGKVVVALTAMQAVTMLLFGIATGFALAVGAVLAYGLARSLTNPAYMTWLNQNIDDSRVRATVISFHGQLDAVGQAGGGPVMGVFGNLFGIRAALAASAGVLVPGVGFYSRAIRRRWDEAPLEEVPVAERVPV